MPATRLANPAVDLAKYDVVGKDDPTPFIRHLGLAALSGAQTRSAVVVYDMGPPLQSSGNIQADVHGTVGLDDNEARKLKSFIDRHQGEHEAQQLRSAAARLRGYCIYPHSRPESDDDGTDVYIRFSCAGFVIEAYGFAGIVLIDLTRIPPVSREAIEQAYPVEMRCLARFDEKTREDLGLAQYFPLPIVFCGYIIHALNRTPSEIRAGHYQAVVGNNLFP